MSSLALAPGRSEMEPRMEWQGQEMWGGGRGVNRGEPEGWGWKGGKAGFDQ
jgi:hypothetical protein